jgi:hypothetical protein
MELVHVAFIEEVTAPIIINLHQVRQVVEKVAVKGLSQLPCAIQIYSNRVTVTYYSYMIPRVEWNCGWSSFGDNPFIAIVARLQINGTTIGIV